MEGIRSRKIGLQDVNQTYFLQLPQELVFGSHFVELTAESLILLSYLHALNRASMRHGDTFLDGEGYYFINVRTDTLCQKFRVSERTLYRRLNELENYGLIERKRIGQGKCSIIYVLAFETDETQYIGQGDSAGLEIPEVEESDELQKEENTNVDENIRAEIKMSESVLDKESDCEKDKRKADRPKQSVDAQQIESREMISDQSFRVDKVVHSRYDNLGSTRSESVNSQKRESEEKSSYIKEQISEESEKIDRISDPVMIKVGENNKTDHFRSANSVLSRVDKVGRSRPDKVGREYINNYNNINQREFDRIRSDPSPDLPFIDFQLVLRKFPYSELLVRGIRMLIEKLVKTNHESYWINQQKISGDDVRRVIRMLDTEDILFVMDRMQHAKTIKKPTQYLLAVLYNAHFQRTLLNGCDAKKEIPIWSPGIAKEYQEPYYAHIIIRAGELIGCEQLGEERERTKQLMDIAQKQKGENHFLFRMPHTSGEETRILAVDRSVVYRYSEKTEESYWIYFDLRYPVTTYQFLDGELKESEYLFTRDILFQMFYTPEEYKPCASMIPYKV